MHSFKLTNDRYGYVIEMTERERQKISNTERTNETNTNTEILTITVQRSDDDYDQRGFTSKKISQNEPCGLVNNPYLSE